MSTNGEGKKEIVMQGNISYELPSVIGDLYKVQAESILSCERKDHLADKLLGDNIKMYFPVKLSILRRKVVSREWLEAFHVVRRTTTKKKRKKQKEREKERERERNRNRNRKREREREREKRK